MKGLNVSDELDFAREKVASALYAPDYYTDAITLACAATYKVEDLFSAARILCLGEKGSGKSTLLTIASYLAQNAGPPTGVLAMTAPSYTAEYRLCPTWTPTLDEVNHLFGESGSNGQHSKFYTYLNQGYRRDTAFAQHQENKVPMRIPIFGFAFLAGRGLACPPDLRERAIILKMKRAPSHALVADFSDQYVRNGFTYAAGCLQSWVQGLDKPDMSEVRGLHPALVHRVMDVWGPLLWVAKQAGDVWLKRGLLAFERLELDAAVPVYAPETQILLDYLAYNELTNPEEGIASGEFAAYATGQEHGAYLSMRPGQFKQFAVANLGPTAPFYRKSDRRTVRGWTDTVHMMNMDKAGRTLETTLAADEDKEVKPTVWEDF